LSKNQKDLDVEKIIFEKGVSLYIEIKNQQLNY